MKYILSLILVYNLNSKDLTITWQPVTNSKEYVIDYGTKNLQITKTITKNSIKLDLEENKNYFFRVKAQNLTNESDWSKVLYLGFTNQVKINKLSTPEPKF